MSLFDELRAASQEPAPSIEEYKAERREEIVADKTPHYKSEAKAKAEAKAKPIEEKVEDTNDYAPWEEDEKKAEDKSDAKDEDDEEDDDVIVTDQDKKVPLKKLLKIKALKKQREEELAEYKLKVQEYEARIKQTLPKEEVKEIEDVIETKLKELSEPNPNNYNDFDTYFKDKQEYDRKVNELKEERIVKNVRSRFEEEARQAELNRQSKEKTESFVNKIEEASKTKPEIKKAIGWFENKIVEKGGIGAIDPNVQQALVLDENAPELIYRVVKDRELVEKIFNKSNPIEILKKIGRLAAYIELENEVDSDEKVSNHFEEAKPKKPNVPRTVVGNSAGANKSSDKAESLLEYKKLREREILQERKNRRR